MALGDAIDTIIPMAALRRFVPWTGKTIIHRALRCRGESDNREKTDEKSRREFRGWMDMCISRRWIRDTSHLRNLRKNLGRNAPQFRTAWGLFRARTCDDKAQKDLARGLVRGIDAASNFRQRFARRIGGFR